MLEKKIEIWYEKVGRKLLCLGIIFFAVYIILKFHILNLIAPFIAAWILASILNPIVTWFHKKVHLSRGIGTILSMLTVLSSILWFVMMLIQQLWHQITAFARYFPTYSSRIIRQFAFLELENLLEQLLSGIGTFLTSLIPNVYNMISKVPSIIIFIIVMLIAVFFMTRDYNAIKAFVKAQFSDEFAAKLGVMQRSLIGIVGGYIKTQLILMFITFCICLAGLLLFNMQYALLISSSIALVDVLPAVGSGIILVPWIIYNLFIGNYVIAMGLVGIYGILFVTRQVMEPKILSYQLGMSVLATVMAMYIGYKVMGIYGLIGGPIVMVFITTLQGIGILPQFKRIKDKESKESE